ncbi:hypothetical protein GGS24DRAFT_205683 [Hypoxylon argillaceum]|nr:hypothetical protein GGS24DRAFT_205683 [Hypoxylon argillaceum]
MTISQVILKRQEPSMDMLFLLALFLAFFLTFFLAYFLASLEMRPFTFPRSLWKRPHEQLNVNVPLLKVPVELIGCIATFLEPADKVLLSQTCRSLRACLRKHSSAAHLSRADYFVYLAGKARELPEQWVCDYCMSLHRINKRDKPTAEWPPSSCRADVAPAPWRRTRLGDTCHIGIEHHHVQLALKYTRLQQPKYDSYLRALLEPCRQKLFNTSGKRWVTHEVRYSAYPRIDTGSDGNPRFLLYSLWQYLAGGRDLILPNLGCQRICPHLEFRDDNYMAYNNCLLQCFLGVFEPSYADAECRGSCSRCATDFSVMRCGQSLYLQVWQDLGPEGSPLDLAWRCQNIRPGLDGIPNSATTGPTVYHKGGSIAELYGPAPRRLPVPKRRTGWYCESNTPSP